MSDDIQDVEGAKKLETLTYTAIKSFLQCRQYYKHRYIDKLAKRDRKTDALFFGSAIHEALECWHGGDNAEYVMARLNAFFKHDEDPTQKIRAKAMMAGYMKKYPSANEPFEIIDLEREFEVPLINPATGHKSRTFCQRGKIDGLVSVSWENAPVINSNGMWLLEHKTSAEVDGPKLERLRTDLQIRLYAIDIEEEYNLAVIGVIYNLLKKTTMRVRKNDSGDDYEKRLIEVYSDPSNFHREWVVFDRQELDAVRRDIWAIAKDINAARRDNAYYKNSEHCIHYNRPCQFLPLCASQCNSLVKEAEYEVVEKHPELNSKEENGNGNSSTNTENNPFV